MKHNQLRKIFHRQSNTLRELILFHLLNIIQMKMRTLMQIFLTKTQSFPPVAYALLCTIVYIDSAQSQYLSSDVSMGLTQGSYLNIEDNVSGGCWTNANSILSISKLIFEQSSIHVLDQLPDMPDPFWNVVNLSMHGYRTENFGCIGHAIVEVIVSVPHVHERDIPDPWGVIYLNNIFSETKLLISNSSLNTVASDFFEGAISEFAYLVMKNRRNAGVVRVFRKTKWSFIKPPSEEEVRKRIVEGIRAR